MAMACGTCKCEIRGPFEENLFALLSSEERVLLEMYLLCGFSIKALGERTGLGYLALRNRIDALIENYRLLMRTEERAKAILEEIEKGEITAAEAAAMIRHL